MTDPATARRLVVVIEGDPYSLMPYGQERNPDSELIFSTPCHICGAEPEKPHAEGCRMGASKPYRLPERCRDCGVPVGQVHVLTCGIEQCPRCRHQYMSCPCANDEDGPGEPE